MHRNGLSRRNNGNGKDEPNGKGTQKTRTAGAVHFHGGGDCGGFNALLCGLRLKNQPRKKTVSGIITVIADGKYTLQPGTIESTENQFPGGMNDGSRRDGSAPAAPNNNSKISDNDGAEPADSSAKDTNTNDRNDTGKQSEGNPPEGNPPEGNPGSGMNPGGSKISFTENGEAAIEFTVAEGAYIASGTEFVSADKLAVGSIVTVRLNGKNEAQAMIICSAEAGGADAAIPNDPNGQKNTAAPEHTDGEQ